MSLLDATILNDLQAKGAIDEAYYPEQGLLKAVNESSKYVDYISEDTKMEMMQMSSARDAQIPYFTDGTVVVNTSPGFDYIPSNLETSAAFNFVAVDVMSGFDHYPTIYKNNQISEKEAILLKSKRVFYEMANSVETLLATQMELIKTQALSYTTQFNQGDGTYTFNAGTDVLEINKAAQKELMYSNLVQLMAANSIGGQYRIVTNRGGTVTAKNELLKYGLGNSKDLASAGFFGMDRLHESANISAGSNVFNGWLLRDGSMGIVTNHPYDFFIGKEMGARKWSVTPAEVPFLGMKINVHVNKEATDARALGATSDSNLIMTTKEQMGLWARFYITYRPNSARATKVSDIIKLSGLTT